MENFSLDDLFQDETKTKIVHTVKTSNVDDIVLNFISSSPEKAGICLIPHYLPQYTTEDIFMSLDRLIENNKIERHYEGVNSRYIVL